MRHTHIAQRGGFTLIELTMAVAIFAIVMGAAAQALVSYHTTIRLQHDRSAAIHNCKAVLSQMRNVRDQAGSQFPAIITEGWPNDGEVSNVTTLRGERIVVTYTDPTANPLEVTVRSTFLDLQNRPVTVRVSTRLTDV